jgi:hypothetical protein
MILPSRFIVLAMLIVVAAGYGLPVEIDSKPLIGLFGLVGGVVGFIALNLIGYAIERRKPKVFGFRRYLLVAIDSSIDLNSPFLKKDVE